jgi:hypothetical protein
MAARRYSLAELYSFALSAGFKPAEASIMAAIAMGESGGRSDAIGDTALQTGKWGPSVGLWQIRSLNSQTGTGGVRDRRANMDPLTNARNAYRVFVDAGRKFRPWTVFTKGTYRRWMGDAVRMQTLPRATTQPARPSWRGVGGEGASPLLPRAFMSVRDPRRVAGSPSGEPGYGPLTAEDLYGFGDLPPGFAPGFLEDAAGEAFTAEPFRPVAEEDIRPRLEGAVQRKLGSVPQDLIQELLKEWRTDERRYYDQSTASARAEFEGGAGGGTIEQVPDPQAFALARTKERFPTETQAHEAGSRVFGDFLQIIGAR